MSFDWQSITTIVLVAAALVYVPWRIWRRSTKTGPRCADCSACGPQSRKPPLVPLDPKP